MSDALSDDPRDDGLALWSKNRIEALTDGIYAVAMTLLVIDLKVPDRHLVASPGALHAALVDLAPKAIAWVISFLVLATFWIGHHRLFHHVRVVDATLLWRNVQQLLLVSLLPFSASLIGEFGATRDAQLIYNGNMMLLAVFAAWQLLYVHRRPALQARPLRGGAYHAALLRNGGLIVAGGAALAIAWTTGSGFATFTYLLMVPVGRVSRHLAARDAKRPSHPPSPAHSRPS